MARSLNYKIFRLVASLLVCTSLAILLAVWATTTAHTRAQADNNLQVASGVLRQVLESRRSQLINSADVLTADFGFKQAVASEDLPTISSALDNHGRRISADLMVALTLNGEVLAATDESMQAGQAFPAPSLIETTLSDGGVASFLRVNDRLYQCILLTVDTPRPSAIAVIGFEIDKRFVASLENIVNLKLSVVASQDNQSPLIISTGGGNVSTGAHMNNEIPAHWWLPFSREDMSLSKRFSLDHVGGVGVSVVLTQDLSSLVADFERLQLQITLISGISVTLALVLVIIFSKKLVRPLTRLAQAARRVAEGNYDRLTNEHAGTRETNDLLLAFRGMQSDIKSREDEIVFRANHDGLTHLHNRLWVSRRLEELITAKKEFQAVIIDVVNLRGINDTFGYQNGDDYLKSLADRLLKLSGDSAHLGGGELVWLPQTQLDLASLTEIKATLEKEHALGATSISNKLALGVLHIPADADDIETAFRRLSITIEHAKKESTLIYRYLPALEEKYLARLHTVSELRRVLHEAEHELDMFYQPKLRVGDRKVVKVEALIRWFSRHDGFIPPDFFIPLAEQSGLINNLTVWVVRRVISDLASWRAQGFALEVAINLSMRDIQNTSLLPTIIKHCDEHKIPHAAFTFELTESEIMRDPESALDQLKKFRDAGFQLSIDDFGTGYSSLAYLRNMPISELKIDKSFVLNLVQQEQDQAIVKTIISLAHQFNLDVVAEGVEAEAALSLLEKWSCDWIQGYHISKPMPAKNLIEWLAESRFSPWSEEKYEGTAFRH